MDHELAQSIAAYGGLALGLVNAGVTIHEKYFKRPKLTVKVENAWARCECRGTYYLQINLSVSAVDGDIYLRNLRISNPERDYAFVDHKHLVPLQTMFEHEAENITNYSIEEFLSVREHAMKDSFAIRNLPIKSGETRSMTAFEGFASTRLQDGWQECPLEWILSIEYGEDKSNDTRFSFVVTDEQRKQGMFIS